MMRNRTLLVGFLAGFVLLCGYFIFESGLFDQKGQTSSIVSLSSANTDASADTPEANKTADDITAETLIRYGAVNSDLKSVVLGSHDEETGFKFSVELTTRGAAIQNALFSEWNERTGEEKKPLSILSPVIRPRKSNIYSLANEEIRIGNQKLDLSLLNWEIAKEERNEDGSQSVTFEAIINKKIKTDDQEIRTDLLKLIKTYSIEPGSYDVKISLDVVNLVNEDVETFISLQGPTSISREGSRRDMRNIIAGYLVGEAVESTKREQNVLREAMQAGAKEKEKDKLDLSLKKQQGKFLWAGITNKYFAAIVRPVPDQGLFSTDVQLGKAQYHDPISYEGKANGDEDISFNMTILPDKIEPKQTVSYDFELFVGPKIKELFEENPTYNKLGYIQTISFMSCFCCPDAVINPLSFGIMWLMKMMYPFVLHNYGLVIIVFVLLIRFVLHPVTKKSQINMMKMQKITSDPEMVEIKKKYANNRAEMQKATMQFYRDRNISPAAGMTSMLPMLIQMPIWIALYRAIYANIELRGAAFLPVWITDLSAPDALVKFTEPIVIPLAGWTIDSFNLLPVLLAIAMFLQQKLMSNQSQKNIDPQVAQQQKMMLFMMPIMMLIFLYTAPSGLNLYIMASTFGGVIEQTVIRKHIREKEEEEAHGRVAVTKKTGGKQKKKKPKPFYKQ